MPLFWNWFWHIFGFVLIMLFGLPSFMIRRIVKKYSLHQKLDSTQIQSAEYQGRALSDSDIESVVSGFNSANFLLKRELPMHYQVPGIHLALVSGDTEYDLYPYAGEIDVIRVRKGKKTVYQVRSEALVRWFSEQEM